MTALQLFCCEMNIKLLFFSQQLFHFLYYGSLSSQPLNSFQIAPRAMISRTLLIIWGDSEAHRPNLRRTHASVPSRILLKQAACVQELRLRNCLWDYLAHQDIFNFSRHRISLSTQMHSPEPACAAARRNDHRCNLEASADALS